MEENSTVETAFEKYKGNWNARRWNFFSRRTNQSPIEEQEFHSKKAKTR